MDLNDRFERKEKEQKMNIYLKSTELLVAALLLVLLA